MKMIDNINLLPYGFSMSKLLRHYRPGQIYFITAVTHRRMPILIDNCEVFWGAMRKAAQKQSFGLAAWVILPDHFHLILDPKTHDLSALMQRLKLSFSTTFRHRNNQSGGKVWQARFWDHIIRNQEDMNRHVDYVHYNPVKHGFVNDPFSWTESSIHHWHDAGFYARDWGVKENPEFVGNYGE